jgi:hypothetical protein
MSEKYYKLIEEIPLFNWVKINAGDLHFIKKEDDCIFTDQELSEAWDILFDDYLDKRGLGKQYKKLLDVMKKKTILQCEFIISGDLFKLTQIEVEEQNLRQLISKDQVDISVEKSLVFLSKWIGYRLDWKIITLTEYYIIMEEYGKAN